MSLLKTTWFLFERKTKLTEEYSANSKFGFYRLLYAFGGSCIYEDENGSEILDSGAVYLLPAKSYSLKQNNDEIFDHIWGQFQIDGWQINEIIEINIKNDPVYTNYLSLIKSLSECYYNENGENITALSGGEKFFPVFSNLFSSFITYLYLYIYKTDDNKNFLDKVIDYIKNHLSSDLSNDTLAETVQYSRAHFIQEFTKAYGISPQKYVVKVRISLAIQMLMNNEKIYNIAYKVGYDNPKSFARAFKRETGISPQKYKEINHLNFNKAL